MTILNCNPRSHVEACCYCETRRDMTGTYDFSSCFPPKFKKSAKRCFSRDMTYLFGSYGPKIGGGGPPTQIVSKNIKHLEVWPILGYFYLLWALKGLVLQNTAAHQCTCLWRIFDRKSNFLWILRPKNRDGGVPPTRVFSQIIKNPGIRPILEYFCLLWGGAAEQCCTPVYLYSIV